MPKEGIDFAAMPNTAIKVATSPATFFREMPKTGGFGEPLLFLMAMSVVTGVIQALLLLFGLAPDVHMSFVVAVGSIILYPLLAAVVGFIVAAIVFVIWKVMGSKEPYETSYRCVAYLSALWPVTSLLGAIPVLGAVLGIALLTFFYVTASVETHKLEARKAWIVFGIIGLILIAFNIGGRMASRSMQQRMEKATQEMRENAEKMQKQMEEMRKKGEEK